MMWKIIKVFSVITTMILMGCGGSESEESPSPNSQTFAINATANTGGSITPSTTSVVQGRTAQFQLTPEPGHLIDNVMGCQGVLDGRKYVTGAVNSDCTITANFIKKTYLVTGNANIGGIISDNQTIEHGQTATFSVTANAGYTVNSVNDDCTETTTTLIAINNNYTTAAITKTCMVTATFTWLLNVNVDEDIAVFEKTADVMLTGQVNGNAGALNLTYQWTQATTDPALVALTNATTLTASFTAPTINSAASLNLNFTLTVVNDNDIQAFDDITVTVNPILPIANAGASQTKMTGALVTLDGSASKNPAPNQIFSYFWSQSSTDTSGITIMLTNSDTVNPTFTVPEVNAQHTLTFELAVEDYRGLKDTSQTNITISPTPPQLTTTLNDTGVVLCAYSSGIIDCSDPVITTPPNIRNYFFRQDGHFGRDVTHHDDSDGSAGFSFTKLDADGNVLEDQRFTYNVEPWSCVQDNVTGLRWEVKTLSGLRNKENTYTWYNNDMSNNGGEVGKMDDGLRATDT
ncbi:MAG: hypothetical protein HRU22_16510, partial [Gammaproteobacteria bacterium]|nr:hypothetical protein [Gammaproteobacteria bacterium]